MVDGPPPDVDQGSGLNSKLGPLPYWAWLGMATAAGVVGIIWWRSRKNAGDSSQAPQSSAATSPEASGIPTEQYESLLALLRDIQGQASTPIPGNPTPTPPPTYGGGDNVSSKQYAPFTISVTKGQKVEDMNAQIIARHGGHIHDWGLLESANPSLASNINWGPSGSKNLSLRTFKNNATYTIPAMSF